MKAKYSYLLLLAFSLNFGQAQNVRKENGVLVTEGIDEIPSRILEKLEQYQNIRSAVFLDWVADGKGMLIKTRFGESAQIHFISKPSAYRQQLTFFKEPAGEALANPVDPNIFVFTRDVGGNENFQIYLFNRKTNQFKLLTDGKSRYQNIIWSKRGDEIAYTSNKRNGKDTDIYTLNPWTGVEKMVLQVEGGGWDPSDWMDGQFKMLVKNYISITNGKLYLLDLKTGILTQLNVSSDEVAYGNSIFSKDGESAFLVSDQDREFSSLQKLDLGSGKKIPLVDLGWDVNEVTTNEDETRMAVTSNEDGYSRLYHLDVKSGRYELVNGVPMGIISNIKFHPDGKTLGFTLATSTISSDAFSFDTDKKELVRWTFSEIGALDAEKIVAPELIRFSTFDSADGKSRMIPAFVFRQKKNPGKSPVIINIHGGPEAQYLPFLSGLYQYLVNELGVTVIAPNVRGSTGYGKSYVKLDNGYLRENSVKDIGKLLDWIATQPDLDPSRVAVWGGSYGGYMTLASMTHFNDRLKLGIDNVGISNFVTFLKNTSEYRRDLRRVEYGDERDNQMLEFLNRISPNNNVQKITKPMFIIQGLNDPRVPTSEAEQMLESLKKNGNTAWYLLAKDEGHGFKKKTNVDFYNASIIYFLEKYLLQ